MKRENFTPAVRGSLAHRAGYSYSNPKCEAPTAGPSEEADSARSDVGVAAHIKGASPGGPRFDGTISDAERFAIENGIWLCQVCAKKVDDDVISYSVPVLRSWKRDAEARAAQKLGRPNPTTNAQSRSRDPLERLIAHRMRDAVASATFPIAMLLPRSVGNEAAYPLSQLMQSPPTSLPGCEFVGSDIVRPIAEAIATPKLLETAIAPSAPAATRWIDWILLGFRACAAECDDAIHVYASRGPSILIAEFEVLKRHLANTIFMLSSLALSSPHEITGANGSLRFEHTLKVLMRAQRLWLDFLTEW